MSIQEHATKFEALKKENSPFLKLDDGESAKVVLRRMKADTKTDDKTGITNAVMKFEFDVESEDGLKVKIFNTSSSKLINALIEKGIDVGSSFTITKHGEKLATTYEITDVVNKEKSSTPATNATNTVAQQDTSAAA